MQPTGLKKCSIRENYKKRMYGFCPPKCMPFFEHLIYLVKKGANIIGRMHDVQQTCKWLKVISAENLTNI